MPAEHSLRFDDLQGLENVGSQRVHAHEHQPVNAGEGQTARGLAAEHIQLVPEHENFGLQRQPTLVSGRDKAKVVNRSVSLMMSPTVCRDAITGLKV